MRALYVVLFVFAILSNFAHGVSNYVNTFVGSGGEGFGIGSTPPGPQTPFGMVRLTPDTVAIDDIFIPFNHFGGYYYNDGHIRLFSHTHTVGAGVLDYGTIGVMPINQIPSQYIVQDFNFRSSFSHDSEAGTGPGYYRVFLDDPQILAELSATTHVGAHRYSWSTGSTDNYVLFDTSYTLATDGCGNSSISINLKNQLVTGYNLNMGGLSNRFGGMRTYFAARFNATFTSYGVWDTKQNIISSQSNISGCGSGGFVGFTETGVEMFVGISFISVEQALINLNAEVPVGTTFDQVKEQTQNIWEAELSKIQVETQIEDDKAKFYTALYHTLLAPTTFSEVGGVYLGFDNQVHTIENTSNAYYTDMSIWDVHRTEFPWLGFFEPTILRDIVRSLVLMYKEGGDLPMWPMANGYTGCMIGQHADIIIADAYFKGIQDFDVQSAYQGMRAGATEQLAHAGRTAIQDWVTIGYIPYDASQYGACETVEYSYDDWAVGNIAGALGFESDQKMFLNRSKNYKNVWYNDEQFFCPKTTDGTWNCPDLYTNVFDSRYKEGDAWQWRWFAPHDVEGLISLFESKEYFVDQLNEFFSRSEDDPFNVLPNPYYWAGNEPDIFAVWLFNYAGRQDLTQQYSRWNLNHKYSSQPDGLPGNDDYGTMSAWFVWASIGIYPLSGSSTYMVGSPLYDSVAIATPSGTLKVVAYNNSPTNVYVQKVLVNGQSLSQPFLDHANITGNALIEFYMTSTPQKTFQ